MNLSQMLHLFSSNLDNLVPEKNRNSTNNSFFVSGLLFALAIFDSTAQNKNEWPCFHGANRTNKSDEIGLIRDWQTGGPELLWAVSGLGEGYSTVSIGDGLIYTAGTTDNQTYVIAYDLNGSLVWKKPNGKAWSTNLSYASSYTGSRGTPTYDNGIVYFLGETGRLTAYRSKTGEEIWSRNLAKDFDAAPSEYGYSESVLIDRENLYCRPSGKKGFVVCLNKVNGKLIWANTVIPGSEGYSSLIINEFGGDRQVIGSSSNHYFGLDAASGRLLWKVKVENQRELNITDATVLNEYIVISTGYGFGTTLYKLRSSGKEVVVETMWHTDLMDNHHGGIIINEGYLYGSGSNSRGWFCLDFKTGKQLWKSNGKGSLTFADGMLYLLDEKGMMKLVRATPDKYELHGEFNVPVGGTGPYWAHPVVCGGRLYIRHSDKLFVYNISRK